MASILGGFELDGDATATDTVADEEEEVDGQDITGDGKRGGGGEMRRVKECRGQEKKRNFLRVFFVS
jgi:hypothetical protein